MLHLFSLLLLAFAVSLDGFGVGVTYGLRRIRIPLVSVIIISCWSGVIIYTSMGIGVLMSRFVSPVAARDIGAFILMGIGLWALYQILMQKKDEPGGGEAGSGNGSGSSDPLPASAQQPTAKEVLYIELKRFGLVIQILRTPQMADMDRSGIISAYEATLLGLALSLDAFGAGIGAALLGFAPGLTAGVIALASGTFLSIGLRIGFRYADLQWVRKLSFLPGFVLILMGIMKLF